MPCVVPCAWGVPDCNSRTPRNDANANLRQSVGNPCNVRARARSLNPERRGPQLFVKLARRHTPRYGPTPPALHRDDGETTKNYNELMVAHNRARPYGTATAEMGCCPDAPSEDRGGSGTPRGRRTQVSPSCMCSTMRSAWTPRGDGAPAQRIALGCRASTCSS